MSQAAQRKPTIPDNAFTRRARYETPSNVFQKKRPQVPRHLFAAERAQAFDPATPSGFIKLDLGPRMGFSYAATTPLVLARYARILAGEKLSSRLRASGEIYYVITGSGSTTNGDTVIDWGPGDVFCLPGGEESQHLANGGDAVLFVATDEPFLSFSHLEPPRPENAAVEPVHYPAALIQQHLDEVYARSVDDDAAGMAVQFVSDTTAELGSCLPTLSLALNSLEPGKFQRPHQHNSMAITLSIQGEGCYSLINGERIDWQPDTVMVTPPIEVHSHHNDGKQLMRCLIVQDGGFYYHARTIGFRFADT